MGQYHSVAQGEFLSKIARAHGFSDDRTIWDAPENTALREQRKDPNVLLPGDRLFIPDRELREEARFTDQRHRFKVTGQTLRLRIKLMGLRNEVLAGHECTLTVEAEGKNDTTTPSGIIENTISPTAGTGVLLDRGKPGGRFRVQREIPLRIGNLDPVDTISGQLARLNNLGYRAGDVPEQPLTTREEEELRRSSRFRSAVEEFQCDFGLTVDGVCGRNTQAKLLDAHGC